VGAKTKYFVAVDRKIGFIKELLGVHSAQKKERIPATVRM